MLWAIYSFGDKLEYQEYFLCNIMYVQSEISATGKNNTVRKETSRP